METTKSQATGARASSSSPVTANMAPASAAACGTDSDMPPTQAKTYMLGKHSSMEQRAIRGSFTAAMPAADHPPNKPRASPKMAWKTSPQNAMRRARPSRAPSSSICTTSQAGALSKAPNSLRW